MNVIGAVLLMVAKRFNAREVFQSAPLLIQERFIDSKIVGIAMHVDNGLLESDYLLPQSYKEILKAVSETVRLKPDVVLLDVRLPDGNGFDACRQLRKLGQESRVLILTSYADDETIFEDDVEAEIFSAENRYGSEL